MITYRGQTASGRVGILEIKGRHSWFSSGNATDRELIVCSTLLLSFTCFCQVQSPILQWSSLLSAEKNQLDNILLTGMQDSTDNSCDLRKSASGSDPGTLFGSSSRNVFFFHIWHNAFKIQVQVLSSSHCGTLCQLVLQIYDVFSSHGSLWISLFSVRVFIESSIYQI